MLTQERSKRTEQPLSQLDAVLIDIVRLAAKDDAPGITRRVRRWVGSPAARRSGLSDTLRGEILAALQATPEGTPRTRRSAVADPVSRASSLHPEPAMWSGPASRPALAPSATEAVERIVAEYQQQDRLGRHGLAPTRTLLLCGPPGVGKTMTAAWIADQLGLPLYAIEPSWIMTSLLGDSARNLTNAFHEAQQTPCVALLDEIDAFGKSRDDPYDVGELKRLVTTLLVELDRWPPGKLVIGATNHPGLLDHALERRFEKRMTLNAPGREERASIVFGLLNGHQAEISDATLETLITFTEGCTGSNLRDLVQAAIRNTLLNGGSLDLAILQEALPADTDSIPRETKAAFARAAAEKAGLPHRAIGAMLGCSHATIGRLLSSTAEVA
jgi:hypothetical protein